VYQWERIEDAKAFYSGPWLDGIVQRYGSLSGRSRRDADIAECLSLT
jgi:hypothetical protein